MKSETAKYLKWLLLSPLFLLGGVMALAFLYFVYCEVNKAYWDRKVKEWCEKDGGVTVFEQVKLSKEEYDSLNVPFYSKSEEIDQYYRVSINDVVINKNPFVLKGGQEIVRRFDRKILGVQVSYSRSGGDFIGFSHPSHFGCENIKYLNMGITKSIFIINGE